MNVLLVEDDSDMLNILKVYFAAEGFELLLADNGDRALDVFYNNKIDLAVLDWMIPGISGLELCQKFKASSETRVLMLTARSTTEDEILALKLGADEILALKLGADEYIRKPFDPRVLLVRAKKLLGKDKITIIGDLEIDFQAKKIFKKGKKLKLSKKEFQLLEYLYRNKGKILSRRQLLDAVWGLDYFGSDRTVDTHIRRLRSKIGDDLIKTHRGLGYSLEEKRN